MLKKLLKQLKPADAPTTALFPLPPEPSTDEANETADVHTLDPNGSRPAEGVDILAMAVHAEAAVEALDIDATAWLESDLKRLETNWQKARTSDFQVQTVRGLYLVAHDLKSMGASYGFPAIGRLASSLCYLLARAEAKSDAALINLHIEACRAIYIEGSKSEGDGALAGAICAGLETQVKRILTAS